MRNIHTLPIDEQTQAWFGTIQLSARTKTLCERMNRICALCQKSFDTEEDVILIGTNGKCFPNCLVHKHCIEQAGSEKDVVQQLMQSWDTAQQHRHWFTTVS